MRRVRYPDWDYFDDVVRELECVTSQTYDILQRFSSGVSHSDLDTYRYNVVDTLYYWTGHTWVGSRKLSRVEHAYQGFFKALYRFLMFGKSCDDELFREFSESALYQGTLYRYLGYSNNSSVFHQEYIKPEYNDIYVSWSKLSKVNYIEGKLQAYMTRLTCEVKDLYYGIDLEAFGISCDIEHEVVFPTLEQLVTNVEFLKKE